MIGQANRRRILEWFLAHPGGTNRECSKALGISETAVGRHVKKIRLLWPVDSAPGGTRPNPERSTMNEVSSTSDQRTVNNVMRHGYRVLSDEEKASMQQIKDNGLVLHEIFTALGGSRELSIAKTKLEEAVMWAVKHITA
ncbi:winged helix-turn-helix domain-containing protein [Novosphingobium sp. FKTRR1]|uniref:winged helix-turn-helix domain-containing protein n=1 Tax=Novosphingobium sp. FKTRR1 TaxID=2879118 RepID=UPI001CF083C2|nr:winged helix-turn-helix domain-containing protein [Novosphingobium sp. FKTRR1]